MAKLSASKAAEAAGVSLPTITRAIKKGKLSAVPVTDTNGGKGYEIDTSELMRVFPPKQTVTPETPPMLRSETPNDNGVLQVEIKMLREMLDQERATVADLRGRLDDEAAERRKLTLLLTDQSTRPAPPVAQERPKRAWWRFGRAND